jgi:hypothetical protein
MKWLCVDGFGGSCRIDGDVEMGQSKLSDWTLEMQQVTGCYQTSTLLLEKCKCLMTEKWNRCDKQPGSWIKVNAKVQTYLVAGQCHAQMSDICAEILAVKMPRYVWLLLLNGLHTSSKSLWMRGFWVCSFPTHTYTDRDRDRESWLYFRSVIMDKRLLCFFVRSVIVD